MTLSHYQNLFQNGYHIFQNTGYWCLKEDVPSPYSIDEFIESSRGKRRFTKAQSSSYPDSSAPEGPPAKRGSKFRSPDTFEDDYEEVPLSSSSSSTTTTATAPSFSAASSRETTGLPPLPSDTAVEAPKEPPRRKRSVGNETEFMLAPDSLDSLRFQRMKEKLASYTSEVTDVEDRVQALKQELQVWWVSPSCFLFLPPPPPLDVFFFPPHSVDLIFHPSLQVKEKEERLVFFLQSKMVEFCEHLKTRVDSIRSDVVQSHEERYRQAVALSHEASSFFCDSNQEVANYFPVTQVNPLSLEILPPTPGLAESLFRPICSAAAARWGSWQENQLGVLFVRYFLLFC